MLPQVPWGLGRKAAFSRTASAQSFDEFSSIYRGVSSVCGAGEQPGKEGRITVSLCDCSSLHIPEGEMEEKKRQRQEVETIPVSNL